MDEPRLGSANHKVEITQREEVRIQGVIHVESFDDRQVVTETDMGMLTLSGEDFHITSVDLEKGQMVIEGMFCALEYQGLDRSRTRDRDKSLLQRLFR